MASWTHPLALLRELSSRVKLRDCDAVGLSPRVIGRVWIHGGGRIVLGDGVVLDGRTAPIELHVQRGAVLLIGDGALIESGTSIEVQVAISVGAGCRIGPFSKLIDNHYHPVHGDRRKRPPSTPVILEEGVTLESRVIVLPGAYLHRRSTVRAGSVVTRRVPEGATVSGVPSRLVSPGPA